MLLERLFRNRLSGQPRGAGAIDDKESNLRLNLLLFVRRCKALSRIQQHSKTEHQRGSLMVSHHFALLSWYAQSNNDRHWSQFASQLLGQFSARKPLYTVLDSTDRPFLKTDHLGGFAARGA